MDENHSCFACGYNQGGWCKWSDYAQVPMPNHVSWGAIDACNPDWAEDCPAHTNPRDEDDDDE